MIPSASDLFNLEHCPVPWIFDEPAEPWTALSAISDAMKQLVDERPGFYTEYAPGVFIGPGTTVAQSACLQGPAVLGANCEIRHGAFVREAVIAGDGCIVGNSTELKNCLLFDGVQVPHFNYVGDSILGWKAHLGAGVILSNVRLDGRTVAVHHVRPRGASDGGAGPEHVDTGLLKFGALIGDRAEIGCNSVLNPGTVVGRRVIARPLSSLSGVIPVGTVVRDQRR